MENKIKISVCIITYNHEDYISDALQGIFSQYCPFNVEIIISDDCSPDSTKQVVEKYISNCPDNFHIRYFRHEKNLGPTYNLDWALKKCQGEYIAWCEGDDFWTDKTKLNKQITILDQNLSFAMSTHNALIKYEYIKREDDFFNIPNSLDKSEFSFEDVLNKWFIPSASMVFRKAVVEQLPDWYKTVYNGDWTLQLLTTLKCGEIHYLDEVLSVYRKNDKSLSFKIGFDIIKINKNKIYILNKILENEKKQQQIIIDKIESLKKSNLKLKRNLKYIVKVFLKKLIKR